MLLKRGLSYAVERNVFGRETRSRSYLPTEWFAESSPRAMRSTSSWIGKKVLVKKERFLMFWEEISLLKL